MATRWACLGAGRISWDFFLAMRENLPRAEHELVAVAARDIKRAKPFVDKLNFRRAYSSYDDVASDPDVDIVYIGTIHSNHAELSKKMLAAGKHVLCEKPMAINWKQGKEVIDLAKKNKLFFSEVLIDLCDEGASMVYARRGYVAMADMRHGLAPCNNHNVVVYGQEHKAIWSRWFPVYDKLRQELKDGTLGTVKLVKADGCITNAKEERIRKHELHGGGLLDIGLYPIQFACLVYGEMPETITALGNITQTGVDENGCILLKYKSGAMANLTYHTDAGLGSNKGIVMGPQGCVEIEGPFWCPTKIKTPTGVYDFPLKAGDYYHTNSAGLQYEAAAVRKYIQEGKIESDLLPHSHSEMILKIMDEVRQQIGVKYEEDNH